MSLKIPFLVASFISFSIPNSWACSCDPNTFSSAANARAGAGAVFIGVPAASSAIMGGMARTTFSVIRNFKNTPSKRLRVFSSVPNGANCGVTFKKDGGVMLLLASRNNGRYTVTNCGLMGINNTPATARFLREMNDLSR